MKIKILIPVYNDWQSVLKVLDEINNLSIDPKFQISIIIINDASNHDRPNIDENFDNISSLKILNLKKNQGHTRGIATAMKYVYEKDDFDYVIPMDGDGEDRPEEIKNFLNQIDVTNGNAIVGERIKRSEDLLFKSCYLIHKLITLVFTGQSIKFGNYTCLPKSTVKKMIDEKATWNSFSGSLKKVEKNLISIPSIRGPRYFGPSQMNFQKLLKHSLCIMSVFRNTFLIRSALFVVLYILLIKSNASIITAVPLIFLLISVYAISNLALRENMDEFDKSLSNINDIVKIK
jgi:glycosyltransferase involved in cell wall biosynthesis